MGPTCRYEVKTKHNYVVQTLGMQKGLKSTTSIKMCTGRISQKGGMTARLLGVAVTKHNYCMTILPQEHTADTKQAGIS
jgi:hypothetical protein